MSGQDYTDHPEQTGPAISAIRLAIDAAASDATAVKVIKAILDYTVDDAPGHDDAGAQLFLAVVRDLGGNFEVGE